MLRAVRHGINSIVACAGRQRFFQLSWRANVSGSRENSIEASFVTLPHRRSRPTGNETVPHRGTLWVGASFCSMGGRPQRPTIGHRVFPPSILFLVSSPLASQTDVGMKPAASNVVANLLTRHVREAHANSLSSSQNVIQPTAKSVQSPNNSEFCFFRHGFTAC